MSSAASMRQLERRRERRIAVRLAVRLRGTDRAGLPFEENTECENVCRAGVALSTRYALAPGTEVEILIPTAHSGMKSESDFTTRGRVVHVAPAAGQRAQRIGVEFIGPRFQRIFQPESSP